MIFPLDELSDLHGILAHGCFDLLHIGHIRHLQEAKLMHWPLSPLIVTITADRFIAKGDGRPAFDQDTRAEWLDALRAVDFVAIVDEPTAVTAINIIKPNVFVKGQEYQTGILKAEVDAVMKHGGIITHTRERPSGVSSTSILSGQYFLDRSRTSEHLTTRIQGGCTCSICLAFKA